MKHKNCLLLARTLSGRPSDKEIRFRRDTTALGSCLAFAFLLTQAPVVFAQNTHTLPLFMSASNATQQGFMRIINRSDTDGTVRIHAFDDEGNPGDSVDLSLAANATVHINSGDLEDGKPDKGLSGGIGSGEGNWRLRLDTNLDIEPLAYIRTADGFLTSVHDVAQHDAAQKGSMRWHVPIFNPGSNLNQKSQLRVINTSGIDADVVVTGVDDGGSPSGEVTISLAADAAGLYSAQELEAGAESKFDGALGNGTGKWQLFVSADRPIQVMSLMSTPTGHLTNLSSTAGDGVIRGGPGGDELRGGAGNDVINPGDNGNNENDIVHGSAGDDRIVYTDSGPNAAQLLRYVELTAGITVTIEGAVNQATVDKGSAGTDTIVDIANTLNAAGTPPYNGVFELFGTPFNDVYDLALDGEQWMSVLGDAGVDTFNIESGAVRIDYETSTAGVDVDLANGRADDDGFGDSDRFNGTVWGVAGSNFDDVLRGSDRRDTFTGRAGTDRIDGRDGRDRLFFGSNNPRYAAYYDIGDIEVDLEAGTATGTWDGMAFSYTLSSIEEVRTGPGDDTLFGTDGNDKLDGSDGNDIINPRDNSDGDEILGSAGSDRIVYSDSTDDHAYQALNYFDSYDAYYDQGLTVTIDGVRNTATVSKGSDGTDTIVDIENPLTTNGFGLVGTSSDDVFHLTVGSGQWMHCYPGPGDDTFNVAGDGTVRVDYNRPPPRNGIEVDLASGRASDDGFGDVDTFNGRVRQIRGTDLSDTIRGSDHDETFIGRRGNDTIDGRGGRDTLRFDRSGVRDVVVDLAAGTATGIWGDSAYIHRTPWFLAPVEERAVGSLFTYEVSNIEVVRGSRVGRDRLLGSERDERLEGRQGDDVLDGRGGNDDLFGGDGNDTLIGGGSVNRDGRSDDKLEGGAGNDTFVIGYGDGVNTIEDFTNGEDRIDLSALGFASHSDLRAVTSLTADGNGTWIDLSRYGGGGVMFWQYRDIGALDASDFLL